MLPSHVRVLQIFMHYMRIYLQFACKKALNDTLDSRTIAEIMFIAMPWRYEIEPRLYVIEYIFS